MLLWLTMVTRSRRGEVSALRWHHVGQLVPSATFLNTDATRPDFGPVSFDVVVCLYVLIHLPRAGMPSCMAKTSHQTDQESRSTGHRAARSVTVMCITTHRPAR